MPLTLDTVCHVTNNITEIYKTLEHVTLHYDAFCETRDISQITKYIVNTCPPSFRFCIFMPDKEQNMTETSSVRH
jgi:hypothetical protein